MEADLIKHFFPVELLDHFEYRSSQIKMGEHGEFLEVEFEEKNELPDGYARQDYESKDFIVRRVQDFPIRSHAVFLKLRRRSEVLPLLVTLLTREFGEYYIYHQMHRALS
jgi:hypothetical protein